MKKLFMITFLFMALLIMSVSCASTQCAGIQPEYKKFIKEPVASTAYTNVQWKRVRT